MTQTNASRSNQESSRNAHETAERNSRRQFLSQVGAAAAGTGAAMMTGTVDAKTAVPGDKSEVGVSRVRSVAARSVRVGVAREQFLVRSPVNQANGDEDELPDFIGSFTKTLPHNAVGEVDAEAYRAYLQALKGRSDTAWEHIALAPEADRKLANPQASLAFSLVGGDSHAFFMPPAPGFSSAETAAEMAEVYLHALLRDVPFEAYGSDPSADFAARELSTFSGFTGPLQGGTVTPSTLFRGSFAGDLTGNYVSQFLLLPVPQGAALTEQRYQTTVPGDDHMLNREDWLNVLRGGAPATVSRFEPEPRFITTARDLGEYVHQDYTYQTYLQAALILLGLGTPLRAGNPYNTSATQGGFVTFGAAEVLSQIGDVALQALRAAWYQKWQVHRRLRPEVFGGRVQFTRSGERSYPINSELLNSPVLDAVADANNGELWLPMAYPEGSPTHPAYPAGHAAIAGACVTVLKAFFDGSSVIPEPVEVVPGSDGQALQPYSGPEALTVEGELNKLANNIAIGRNLAGVHWRTDGTDGILLGEDVAVRMLRDLRQTYNEVAGEIRFTGFAGNTIVI
ncbi:MAG: vanadium-dependent haloperoxidase [Pseudomonadota bacterium]